MTIETITVAGGCFWCTEAVFLQLNGVYKVESGYIGGHSDSPTYQQVCTGNTGHAEAVRIDFDSDVITLDDLFDIFFATHEPTQLNRQGNDIGTQYRSAIFPSNDQQESAAKAAIERAQTHYDDMIVTKIEHADNFYLAEVSHQDYWDKAGQENAYCMAVIPPKLAKLKKSYAKQLK